MSEKQPYIGAPVTLISSLNVRYEGTLFTIDPNESTVALQNVRCLGTEGRVTGSKSIPPSDATYEFIIFRGENIRSINLAEEKRKTNELNDPSILKMGGKVAPNNRQQKRELKPRGGRDAPGFYDRQYQRRDPAKYQRRSDPRGGGYGNDYRRQVARYRRTQHRGRGGPQRRQYDGPRAKPGEAKFLIGRDAGQEKISISDEFDFEKATFDKKDVLTDDKKAEESEETPKKEEPSVEKIDEETSEDKKDGEETTEESADVAKEATQEEEKKEESPEPAEPAAKPFEYKYNPEKSFFDDLDLTDRSTMDFKARRRLDAKTFGEEASTYKVRRRRRRGGNNRRRRR